MATISVAAAQIDYVIFSSVTSIHMDFPTVLLGWGFGFNFRQDSDHCLLLPFSETRVVFLVSLETQIVRGTRTVGSLIMCLLHLENISFLC